MATEQQQADAGDRAERFLKDEVFQGALENVQRRLHDQWANSAPEDAAKREQTYFIHRALREVVKQIQMDIDSGSVAKANLARFKRKA